MSVIKYNRLFKVVVCGDLGVGKQTFMIRFTKRFFEQDYKLTTGVDFHKKTIDIQTTEGIKRYNLQLWNIAEQERFSSVRPMFYKGALGTLLIFDLTNNESFEHLPNWIEEIRSNSKYGIPILLIGNKCNLINERVINYSDIEDFAKKFNLFYLEINAKSGEKTGDCFTVITYLMMEIEVPDELIGKNGLKSTSINET